MYDGHPLAVRSYLEDLSQALGRLNLSDLEAALVMVEARLASRQAIFIAGNGGSAAVAEHMASDWRAASVAGGGRSGDISSLTENTALITALANDYSYEEIFERQIVERARPGDLLVCLSVSGRSANVLRAAAAGRARQVGVLSLVGQLSPLAELSDLSLLLNVDGDYGLTEDIQSMFMHMAARRIRRVCWHRVPSAVREPSQ